MDLTPRRLTDYEPDLNAVLNLIRTAFAYMDGRIDPPSSMHRLTMASLVEQATNDEIWVVGSPTTACVFLTRRPDSLYIGKLAVAPASRRQGLA